jgi:hypothetical protein
VKQKQKFKSSCFLPVDSDKTFKILISQDVYEGLRKINSFERGKIDRSCQVSVMRELNDQASKQMDDAIMLQIWNENFPETPLKPSKSPLTRALQMGYCFRDSTPDVSGNIPNFVRGNPKSKSQALWLIVNGFRVLNSNGVSRVLLNGVVQAINDNDIGFFKRLGRCLTAAPKLPNTDFTVNPLKRLMFWHWVADCSELQFCVFTDQALADFLNMIAPSAGATFDGVRSTRKRLKLLRTKPLLIKEVTLKGDDILLS